MTMKKLPTMKPHGPTHALLLAAATLGKKPTEPPIYRKEPTMEIPMLKRSVLSALCVNVKNSRTSTPKKLKDPMM